MKNKVKVAFKVFDQHRCSQDKKIIWKDADHQEGPAFIWIMHYPCEIWRKWGYKQQNQTDVQDVVIYSSYENIEILWSID